MRKKKCFRVAPPVAPSSPLNVKTTRHFCEVQRTERVLTRPSTGIMMVGSKTILRVFFDSGIIEDDLNAPGTRRSSVLPQLTVVTSIFFLFFFTSCKSELKKTGGGRSFNNASVMTSVYQKGLSSLTNAESLLFLFPDKQRTSKAK